jgi:hypothetical protein
MNKMLTISDYDVIYISYDEPNAEHNWQDLVHKVPWAKRVHGVKGSDAAHKAAANLSSTDRFITVDGDNVIYETFFDQSITVDDSIDISKTVFSWPSHNIINGLMYGNGGIKCWPKELVLNMRTHELADPDNKRAQIDFCWDIKYIAIETCYSEIHNNLSPLQAWRAGFREGVKMSLDQGSKVTYLANLPIGNFNRLLVWMTVGADVTNGDWAMYGARLGCFMTHFTNWDFVQVRDFDYLNSLWDTTVSLLNAESLSSELLKLEELLRAEMPMPAMLSASQSNFLKHFDFNPDRQPKTVKAANITQYDIVMITYDEINADANWEKLVSRFPRAKRVNGVKGIHNSHKSAANIVKTCMFWVVDGDAAIVDSFDFDYIVPANKQDIVHVWRAKNPVNGLEYGYGGVKLLPTVLTQKIDTSTADMTTSISSKYKPVMEVSNITMFNTDAFSSWRSGFRECCKLSSKVIDRQVTSETTARLDVWCTAGANAPFGEYVIAGANAGREYGNINAGNTVALSLINNFDWLKLQFDKVL